MRKKIYKYELFELFELLYTLYLLIEEKYITVEVGSHTYFHSSCIKEYIRCVQVSNIGAWPTHAFGALKLTERHHHERHWRISFWVTGSRYHAKPCHHCLSRNKGEKVQGFLRHHTTPMFYTVEFVCASFILQRVMPVHLLWALLFLKQYNTEEVNASNVLCFTISVYISTNIWYLCRLCILRRWWRWLRRWWVWGFQGLQSQETKIWWWECLGGPWDAPLQAHVHHLLLDGWGPTWKCYCCHCVAGWDHQEGGNGEPLFQIYYDESEN